MLTSRHSVSGVTLIEMLIAIAVLAILFHVAQPAFQVYMQNSQIRGAADAIMNGLQLARSEAVRRNKSVQITLDAGGGWTVRYVRVDAGDADPVQQRPSNTTQNAVVTTDGPNQVTFTSVGAPSTGTANITRIDVRSSVTGMLGVRPLALLVSTGGNIRMCDPDTHLPTGDPRRCTP